MAEIFKVEIISNNGRCCELSLPAGDHVMFDTYQRLRQSTESPLQWGLLQCKGYEYLAPFVQDESLLAVNLLAQQISNLTSRCIRRSPAAAGAVVNSSSAVTAAAV